MIAKQIQKQQEMIDIKVKTILKSFQSLTAILQA